MDRTGSSRHSSGSPENQSSHVHGKSSEIQRPETRVEMAGLLAWAADVVKAHKDDDDDEDAINSSIPLVFTEEQQKYVRELDQKAASLSRSIRDLRLRLPPPDISQRLPHLHAHSLAYSAALSQQLSSHSSTREQTQLREVTLQEENAAYEKAISSCESRIQEKIQEADSLRRKLKEMDEMEHNLAAELDKVQTAMNTSESGKFTESILADEAGVDTDASESDIAEKLEVKKKELSSMEERVQELEKKWAQVQNDALKQPSPAQREKMLNKQLHSLIEQLEAKQTQAEGLVSEIHLKEKELETLNGLWRRIEGSNVEEDTARNRLRRVTSDRGSAFTDYLVDDSQKLPSHSGGRNETLHKLMLLRSSFVLYILALHIAVFIKISF